VPVLALCIADTPWQVNISFFATYFIPLSILSLIIRCYAQKWVAEPHERGFHLMGGLLRTATWWIFLIGFVYTIFNIKVPYIPTPKEDKPENQWRLSFPNMITCLFILSAACYGLQKDWSPYSLAMAGFGMVNVLILGFIIVISQQKLMIRLENCCSKFSVGRLLKNTCFTAWNQFNSSVYYIFCKGHVVLLVLLSFLFTGYSVDERKDDEHKQETEDLGGFYLGIKLASEKELALVKGAEALLHQRFSIYSLPFNWLSGELPQEIMQIAEKEKALPLLNFSCETESNDFYKDVYSGQYDDRLKNLAEQFIGYRQPVMLSLSPGFDKYDTEGAAFVKAWQHVYVFFKSHGVSNLCWVWSPSGYDAESFYPGDIYVDWIGVECINTCTNAKTGNYRNFAQIYSGFKKAYGKFNKPVIITSFGSCASAMQDEWLKQGLHDISSRYREIKGCIMLNGACCFTTVKNSQEGFTPLSLSLLQHLLGGEPFNRLPWQGGSLLDPAMKSRSRVNIVGKPGEFVFLHEGKPWYIRGVAYNTGHDWRDGNMPLTRKQLEKDFDAITAMGANTVRRYSQGFYDKNIMNVAEEKGLKVMFGFWFDPKVDYYKDTLRIKEYMLEVEETVLRYKDHRALLAWSLGNESWGLLKHKFGKPYLIKVRDAYVRMIETLAQRIHELDPDHSVFSCMEHEEYQIAGELVAFRVGAPSLDAIGINSYYKEQISNLNYAVKQSDSLRPYIISEFGARGYWDPSHNHYNNNILMEETDAEKSEWYSFQWKNYVEAYKGYNIGGVAYCWHDRMEGSITWFGLTDYRGRAKPAYYALRESWTGVPADNSTVLRIIPSEQLQAGASIRFEVNNPSDELNYEWVLIREKDFEQQERIKGSHVKLRIPADSGCYRLHVYAGNVSGKVMTASLPFRISGK
jgi:cellulose synthase (UDP-forming)